MKFDTLATPNPIDRLRVVGKSHDRVEGLLKTTGTAPYAYEHDGVVSDAAYGYVVGAAISKGLIKSIDTAGAKAAPGVIAVVTHENAGPLAKGEFYTQRFLAGPEVDHYHQVAALVVAETFEQARSAAALVRVDYVRSNGSFDLEAHKRTAPLAKQGPYGGPTETAVGDFAGAFAASGVKLDPTRRPTSRTP
jgi:xanthine dehydrogenase YagR molybdenum-binding subunit